MSERCCIFSISYKTKRSGLETLLDAAPFFTCVQTPCRAMASMQCVCAAIDTAQAGRLRQGPARRGGRVQRRALVPRAGLLDTLIKPITSSGEVGDAVPADGRHFCCCRLPLPGAALAPLPAILPPWLARLALQRKPLKEGIANFYDESSQLWESIWVRSCWPLAAAPPLLSLCAWCAV